MRNIILFLLVVFSLTPLAFAYPQDQLEECILGAKRSPIVLGVPEESIQNWCDCALKLIVDEGKDDRTSANQCGKKFFR